MLFILALTDPFLPNLEEGFVGSLLAIKTTRGGGYVGSVCPGDNFLSYITTITVPIFEKGKWNNVGKYNLLTYLVWSLLNCSMFLTPGEVS